jgi:GT2 family glycosyltransferase
MKASETYESSVDVSTIIVNWNSADYVIDCIESIYRETKAITFEIIVIDNASFDGCGEKLAQSYPDVVFIQSDANLGFAKANNIAASRAKGRTLLFLNPDTKVLDRAIERLCSLYWKLPNCGVLGCRLLNGDGSFQDSSVLPFPTIVNAVLDSRVLIKLFPRSKLWGWRKPFVGETGVFEVDAVSGACMMIGASLFRDLGGFSELYFMYSEDVDLCYRAHKMGFINYHASDVPVVHYGGGSSSSNHRAKTTALMRESKYRFFLTQRGLLAAWGFRASMFLAGAFRMALILASWPFVFLLRKNYSVGPALAKWASVCAWSLGLFGAYNAPRSLRNKGNPWSM